MTKRFILLIAPLALLTLVGAGCAQKVAEESTERVIEQSTNGQADVELNNQTITVNTNEGSFQAGQDVKLPTGFPTDVYVIDGTIKNAVTTSENAGYSINIETSSSLSEAKATYERELVANGWTINVNATIGTTASLQATKGERTTTVGITESSGTTLVTITTAEN